MFYQTIELTEEGLNIFFYILSKIDYNSESARHKLTMTGFK